MKKEKRQKPPKKTIKPEKSIKSVSNNGRGQGAKSEFLAPKIKILGVGGAGGNALSRINTVLSGLETIAFNTDIQDLKNCKASKRIQIGKETARGRGSGMDPEIGRRSAEEDREEISKSLEGAEMIFLTCGLGGGTGSGAAPVVAEIARSLGIIVVAVITLPFSFEGKERDAVARAARQKLLEKVDALVTVPNDRVFNIIDANTSLKKAFWQIDEILREGIQAIYDLVVRPGLINVDFADLKTIVKNSGEALLGMGLAEGKDRAVKAAQKAIQSPLLDTTIDHAKGVLFNISAHEDLTMIEVQQAAKTITGLISPDAKVIFGTSFDHRLPKNKIKVTVVATGFEANHNSHSPLPFDYAQGKPFNYSQEKRFGGDDKDIDEVSRARDILKEKIRPFESLEDQPAFFRKNKSKQS